MSASNSRFVLDNGAYLAKSGFAHDSAPKYEFLLLHFWCHESMGYFSNFCCCIKRQRLTPNYACKSKNGRETYVGSQLGPGDDDDSGVVCKDFSCLYYNMPFQRGLCVNWELERQIWSQVFKRHGGVEIDTPVFELKEVLTCNNNNNYYYYYYYYFEKGNMVRILN